MSILASPVNHGERFSCWLRGGLQSSLLHLDSRSPSTRRPDVNTHVRTHMYAHTYAHVCGLLQQTASSALQMPSPRRGVCSRCRTNHNHNLRRMQTSPPVFDSAFYGVSYSLYLFGSVSRSQSPPKPKKPKTNGRLVPQVRVIASQTFVFVGFCCC